jgi:hypothetical protein
MMAFSGVRSSWLMLARNCDVLARHRQLMAFVLDFVEQPHILDRDCCLVSKSLRR